MTKRPLKDVGTSVRARLLRLAHDRGDDFQLVLTRYANERLLFRLASSNHASGLVLKGAALFTVWTGAPHRATRDLDFLGFGHPGVARVQEIFTEVLAMDVPDDGVRFDLSSLAVGLIREDQEYGGVRAEFIARVTNAQVRLQVDVGFGDAITPDATIVEFPVLLDFPAPRLRAYPKETVAEKVEAMVQLGLANSRMKDFYDVAGWPGISLSTVTFSSARSRRPSIGERRRCPPLRRSHSPQPLRRIRPRRPSGQASFVRPARVTRAALPKPWQRWSFSEPALMGDARSTLRGKHWGPRGPWR